MVWLAKKRKKWVPIIVWAGYGESHIVKVLSTFIIEFLRDSVCPPHQSVVAYLILLFVGLDIPIPTLLSRRPSLEEARLRLRLSLVFTANDLSSFSSSFFLFFQKKHSHPPVDHQANLYLLSHKHAHTHTYTHISYPTCLPRRLFRSPLPPSRPPPCLSTASSRRSPSLTTRASGECNFPQPASRVVFGGEEPQIIIMIIIIIINTTIL